MIFKKLSGTCVSFSLVLRLFEIAEKLFDTSKTKKAFDILDHALQVYPANADLLVEMGRKN